MGHRSLSSHFHTPQRGNAGLLAVKMHSLCYSYEGLLMSWQLIKLEGTPLMGTCAVSWAVIWQSDVGHITPIKRVHLYTTTPLYGGSKRFKGDIFSHLMYKTALLQSKFLNQEKWSPSDLLQCKCQILVIIVVFPALTQWREPLRAAHCLVSIL